jgi:hypothetical protein
VRPRGGRYRPRVGGSRRGGRNDALLRWLAHVWSRLRAPKNLSPAAIAHSQ